MNRYFLLTNLIFLSSLGVYAVEESKFNTFPSLNAAVVLHSSDTQEGKLKEVSETPTNPIVSLDQLPKLLLETITDYTEYENPVAFSRFSQVSKKNSSFLRPISNKYLSFFLLRNTYQSFTKLQIIYGVFSHFPGSNRDCDEKLIEYLDEYTELMQDIKQQISSVTISANHLPPHLITTKKLCMLPSEAPKKILQKIDFLLENAGKLLKDPSFKKNVDEIIQSLKNLKLEESEKNKKRKV